MVDLTTTYLGLKLAHPLVPSASPFSKDAASAKQLEDAGASALVMHSLFEEKIDGGIKYALQSNFRNTPEAVLELVDNSVSNRIPGKKLIVDILANKKSFILPQVEIVKKEKW